MLKSHLRPLYSAIPLSSSRHSLPLVLNKMHTRKIIPWIVLLLAPCHGFTSSSKWKASSCSVAPLLYTSTNINYLASSVQSNKPKWVPMELIELACEDAHMTREEFIRTYADIEAYTSCDDEGDDFHQCDFFDQFLGPTKWLHLTPEAQGKIDDIHFRIWKDVWSHPTPAVDLADKVSNECLRYFEEFMLEPRTNAKCPTDRPVIRVKVVPATYGLEGFEDAVWEATEDLMKCSANTFGNANHESSAEECCKAITFVAAAPDIFADPNLMEVGLSSPQAEFEPDRFRVFSSTLREKMVLFSRMEDVPLDDAVQLTAFHPLWKLGDNFDSGSNYGVEVGGRKALQSFPYPCIAVSTDINV